MSQTPLDAMIAYHRNKPRDPDPVYIRPLTRAELPCLVEERLAIEEEIECTRVEAIEAIRRDLLKLQVAAYADFAKPSHDVGEEVRYLIVCNALDFLRNEGFDGLMHYVLSRVAEPLVSETTRTTIREIAAIVLCYWTQLGTR